MDFLFLSSVQFNFTIGERKIILIKLIIIAATLATAGIMAISSTLVNKPLPVKIRNHNNRR